MDAVMGTGSPPSLEDALRWLAFPSDGGAVVVVGNHEEMLKAMWRAKKHGTLRDEFTRVRFVYLRTPKRQLAAQLDEPTAGGNTRDPRSREYTLEHFERFDELFSDLADYTINCSGKTIAEVAQEVKQLTMGLQRGGTDKSLSK